MRVCQETTRLTLEIDVLSRVWEHVGGSLGENLVKAAIYLITTSERQDGSQLI